ncbi:MAG: helix-turn-helix domain-containing protein [Ruminococcaceae bacterium]|nr:helix-turn-helix domain-containing protein [Oscillospiraceae bacterium]
MDYSNLYDLITALEYGTKLHIGVLFFGNFGTEKLLLPHDSTIHSSPVCTELKKRPNGFRRCYQCRNAAIRKALQSQKDFGGLCIHGVYEYTRPITINNQVVCMIFIGNILPDAERSNKLRCHLSNSPALLETLEPHFSQEQCERTGALLESYIRMMLELSPTQKNDSGFDPLIENLKAYVEANLEYKVDLSMLAQIFHYNEKYLGRLFKKKTGMSFSQYINLRRLNYGQMLLKESSDPVIAISTQSGFNNVTYFNRMFKKHFGVTPTEYRQQSL